MHIHDLDGCAPAPLAHYLKALGVLRLVAEQADPQARGWWEGDRFRLATVLTRADLLAYLVEHAQPPAVFNPWGGRSGYFSGGSEVSARMALKSIEGSEGARLASFRAAIKTARSALADLADGKKPGGEAKDQFIADLRSRLRGNGTDWLAVVAAVLDDGDESPKVVHPPIFGSGGNEGSGSYTSAYMQAVVECCIERRHDEVLEAVVFGGPCPRAGTDLNMLQFLPEGQGSPWELILAVAGAMFLRSSVVSRSDSRRRQWSSSPFFVQPVAAGYSSSGRLDERLIQKGSEKAGRGEQWFPLWSRPSTKDEVNRIFVEGRARVGRQQAIDGWSLARATKQLGVGLGIGAFQRYGYLQRDNQALHFAVSLGRIQVASAPDPRLSCLDDIAQWVGALHGQAYPSKQDRSKSESTPLRLGYRALATDLFNVLEHPESAAGWQALLLSMRQMELVQKAGTGFKAQPIPPLRPEWVEAADDGSVEFRLALALALQQGRGHPTGGRNIGADTVRRHWLPLDDTKRAIRFATTGDANHQRLAHRPEVVMQGRSGVADTLALVQRRLVEASQSGSRKLDLLAAPRASAHLADLQAWLTGRVDTDRTLSLACALMALDRALWAEQIVQRQPAPASHDIWPDDAWLCIRLAHLAAPLRDGRSVHTDPAVVRRLASGDAAGAVQLALRRLQAAGIHPALRAGTVPNQLAPLWASALAFPISPKTAEQMLARLHIQPAQENLA